MSHITDTNIVDMIVQTRKFKQLKLEFERKQEEARRKQI